jgi:predicted ATPase
MQINSITIINWKNFKEGKFSVSNRLFIVGPNASGKSNLLDIFRFLRDLCIQGGGFQTAISRRGGLSSIRCLLATKKTDISIIVSLNEDNDNWIYHLTFNQNSISRPIIKQEIIKKNDKTILERPNNSDRSDTELLFETALEQSSANRDFREINAFFQTISYQNLLPQVIRDPLGFSPSTKIENDPFGRDFLQRVEQTSSRTRNARLKNICKALSIAVPQLSEITIERDRYGTPHLNGLYEHWRGHGARQNESQFSDGTLRLFGLLWTMFEGNGPLLLEEPELSLHSEIVRQLPEIITRMNKTRKRTSRQVLISTHSNEMLDNPSIAAEEVIRLSPSEKGTLIISPTEVPDEMEKLKNGLTIADVVLPKTTPQHIEQLTLTFDS